MTKTLEDRLGEAEATLDRLLKQRDQLIAKLCRCELRLKGAARRQRRVQRAIQNESNQPAPVKIEAPKPVEGEPPIPDFLDRRKTVGDLADDAVRARIEADRTEAEKTRTKVNAEKRKVKAEKLNAKLTGATRSMPLTGKQAMAFIRNG